MFTLLIAALATIPAATDPPRVASKLQTTCAPQADKPDENGSSSQQKDKVSKPKENKPQKAAAPGAGKGSSNLAAKPVRVKMKVVDAVTGQPIPAIMIQAGKFNHSAPDKIVWGWSETRTSSQAGNYSTSIRWHAGWTARIVADGYAPHPIFTKQNAPPQGVEQTGMTIKLDRGKLLRGVVLDHTGKPLQRAAVFAVSPRQLNLAGGRAINSWDGKIDKRVSGVFTNDRGQFEMYTGSAAKVAVSHPDFDAWVAATPAGGKPLEIRLPQPAKAVFTLNIPGADKDSAIFYQFLSHHQPVFKGVETVRTAPIKNGGKLVLAALTPGRYQFWRAKELRTGNTSRSGALDHVFLEFKPGQTHTVNLVRKKGSQLKGEITQPGNAELTGVILTVRSLQQKASPFNPSHRYHINYDTRVVHTDAGNDHRRIFTTELLEPGQYEVKAVAYIPLTDQQRFSTGIVRPAYQAATTITVPATGSPKPIKLQLKKAVY